MELLKRWTVQAVPRPAEICWRIGSGWR